MYRNQYDTDVTTFSPVGRLYQVEYAMEAVKQGSAVCGLRSKRAAVLASVRRSPSELASPQDKMFKIDDHLGIGVSGLIADARALSQYMRAEALNYQFVYDANIPIGRLVSRISDKSQELTQQAIKRPYGVGLLVIGVDRTGPHLFETSPSGVHFEFLAQAIGARSQSARTYLEKHYEALEDLSDDDLMIHALKAIQGASTNGELNSNTVSLAIVSVDRVFTVIQGEELDRLIKAVGSSGDAMQTD